MRGRGRSRSRSDGADKEQDSGSGGRRRGEGKGVQDNYMGEGRYGWGHIYASLNPMFQSGYYLFPDPAPYFSLSPYFVSGSAMCERF